MRWPCEDVRHVESLAPQSEWHSRGANLIGDGLLHATLRAAGKRGAVRGTMIGRIAESF